VRVTGNITFAQISAGADHTCGLDAAGAAWCWGLDTFGQLGGVAGGQCPAFGDAQPCATQPIAVAGVPALVSISAGSAHTCGLTLSGDIWCWGRGSEGQLGNGAGMTSMAPVRVVHP
jgi:alpha-tubulin suppressor-like RCC1 family protein